MGRLFWAWLAGFALAVAGISVVFLWTCAKGNHKILRMTESDSPWKTTCITNLTNIIFWGFVWSALQKYKNRNWWTIIHHPSSIIHHPSFTSFIIHHPRIFPPGHRHHPRPLRFNPLVFGMASEIGEGCDPREALKVLQELLSPKNQKIKAAWVFFFFFFGGGLRKAILEGSVFYIYI